MAEFLADAHPSSVSRDSLANALSMANSGGTFSGYVRDLIRAGLAVDDGGGMLRASDLLMHPATVEAP